MSFAILRISKLKHFGNIGGSLSHNYRDRETHNADSDLSVMNEHSLENAEAVKNAKAGQIQYRTDKAGIVHGTIGRASFEEAALRENFDALLDAIVKAKPAAAKGQYLKKVAVSSTMGVGVRVDTTSVSN